jgi:DNA/RNA-binding domain of Phe-tRNA-synthetase-like protein
MTNLKAPVEVSSDVFQKLPGLVLISGIVEVGAEQKTNGIKNYLESAWAGLQQKVADPNSVEALRVQKWVQALKAAGIKTKDFPPSIQAIAKRATKGGPPFFINPIVDVYNAISMELALPLGAYDLGEMNGSLRLRLSAGGEAFMALGSSENDPTLPGEIIYSDSANILTRMFLWRQSSKGKITSETKKFIFVCELLNSMEPELQEKAKGLILEKFQHLLAAQISNLTTQIHP